MLRKLGDRASDLSNLEILKVRILARNYILETSQLLHFEPGFAKCSFTKAALGSGDGMGGALPGAVDTVGCWWRIGFTVCGKWRHGSTYGCLRGPYAGHHAGTHATVLVFVRFLETNLVSPRGYLQELYARWRIRNSPVKTHHCGTRCQYTQLVCQGLGLLLYILIRATWPMLLGVIFFQAVLQALFWQQPTSLANWIQGWCRL